MNMTTTTIEFPLVGFQYYKDNYALIMSKTSKTGKGKITWEVKLIPEDDNPHDNTAVRVDVFGYTLGYVSRLYTSEVRDFLSRNPSYKYKETKTEGNMVIIALTSE